MNKIINLDRFDYGKEIFETHSTVGQVKNTNDLNNLNELKIKQYEEYIKN